MKRTLILLICTVAIADVLNSCEPATKKVSDAPPVVDASTAKLTRHDVARPDDPAGLLLGEWPTVSGARLSAISMAIFHLDADGRQVTVKNLGAEGDAMRLGASVTAEARQISRAFDGAAFLIVFTKSRMASIAKDAKASDRSKITELADDMKDDMLRLGREIVGGH
jgi:hypothetical protein